MNRWACTNSCLAFTELTRYVVDGPWPAVWFVGPSAIPVHGLALSTTLPLI